MIKRYIHILSGLISALLVCPICTAADAQNEPALVVKGVVNDALYQQIKNYVDHGGKTIVITSEGGDVSAGQKIGLAIADKELTVIIRKYCFSSCANYVFLGAKNKKLEPGSILGFHGGIRTKSPADDEDMSAFKFREQLSSMVDIERIFLNKIGVDPALIDNSFLLTKGEKTLIEVTFPGTKHASRIFLDNQIDLVADYILEIRKLDPAAKYVLNKGNAIQSKVYFPSQASLHRYRVQGILDYPYPQTQAELNKWIANIAEDFDAISAIGDFDHDLPTVDQK